MSQEERDEIDEVNMQIEHDNQKENGVHRPQFGKNCKCADCQADKNKANTPTLNMWDKKDRRISWLSIFSSLMGCSKNLTIKDFDGVEENMDIQEISEMAYELNEELYKHYPT